MKSRPNVSCLREVGHATPETGWLNSSSNFISLTKSGHHNGFGRTRHSRFTNPPLASVVAAPIRRPSERLSRTPLGHFATLTWTGNGGTLGVSDCFVLKTPCLPTRDRWRGDSMVATIVFVGMFQQDRSATHRSMHTSSRVSVEEYHRPPLSTVVSMAMVRALRQRTRPANVASTETRKEKGKR